MMHHQPRGRGRIQLRGFLGGPAVVVNVPCRTPRRSGLGNTTATLFCRDAKHSLSDRCEDLVPVEKVE